MHARTIARSHARTQKSTKGIAIQPRALIFQSSRPRESEHDRDDNSKLSLNEFILATSNGRRKIHGRCIVKLLLYSLSLSSFLAQIFTRYYYRYYSLQEIHGASQQSRFITRRLTDRTGTFGNLNVINNMLTAVFPL